MNSLRIPPQVGERMNLAVTGPHSKNLCHMVVTKIGVSHVRPLARAHGDESSISISLVVAAFSLLDLKPLYT